jgi:hypothetical protein
MNTIPTIFNNPASSYTAVGGDVRLNSSGLSAILLNRKGRYPRRTLFKELEKAGFDRIVSVEGPIERYDLEDLSSRFPFVRFITMKEAISPGAQVNLGASEITSPLFFVLWNDLRILYGVDADKISAWFRLTKEELFKAPPGASLFRRLCTVPVIQNSTLETLPTMSGPVLSGRGVKTIRFSPASEAAPTLYPFDGVGLYDRDRFVKLGGYDNSIKNPHWQLMDFGFRSWLWGEDIRCTQMIRLCQDTALGGEDTTANRSYRRFYLKNLAPVFRQGKAYIPFSLFPGYLFKSRRDPFSAWAEFKRGRLWVRANCRRFRKDAVTLTETWNQGPETLQISEEHQQIPPEIHEFPLPPEYTGQDEQNSTVEAEEISPPKGPSL